eukprot:CAMPEP_0194354042 /NCGR_PEP_ID=MMETSP0174-20130528/2227_1 /TAXON_ID=216777 /ORGANISM="Proboscia alata, Strain PI-D3" /LENGTH=675 /DNA_ID=CAMNT_0039122797 /DNA_START=97 /DNA_END=2124 /DNA_ORIENTATION=+
MACIPIGIDLGSLNARIAIASLPKESTSSSLTAIQAFEKSIGIKPSSSSSGTNTSSNITSNVISNAHTGSRYTMAVAVCENEEISMANEGQSNQRLKQPESSTSSFVFGDAARKILERRKIPLEDSLVRAMGLQLDSAGNGEGVEGDAKEEACVSFFAYLGQLAAENVKVDGAAVTNGEATGAPDLTQELLRVVLSLPVHKYAIPTHPGTATSSTQTSSTAVTNNQAEITSLLRCVRTGLERSGVAASTAAGRKKKRGSVKHPHPKYVVGVLHDATAVCVAHGLTDVVMARPIHFEKKEEIEGQRTNWKSCLVIDWGDSGFTATILKKGGGDTASSPLEIVDYLHDPTLSGSTITKLVMKHISDMFERKNRLPANSIAENKRASSKLRACVEDAIRSLARSNGARNTNLSLDGLYEGIDLHLPLSRPRFDMLCGKVLKSAEVLIGKMMARARELNGAGGGNEGLLFDVVLTSGNVSMMPSVESLVTKLCAQMATNSSSSSTPWRGDASIPVDEAVVIGCSKHASMLLHDNLHIEPKPTTTVTPTPSLDPATSIKVPVSPVTIGIRLLDDQEATLDGVPQRTLIAEGTPLPAYTRHTIDLGTFAKPPSQAGADKSTTTRELVLAIVQPSDEVGGKPIVLGKISIPKDSTPYVSLSLSLSITGELAMSVNGSELVSV